MEAWRQAMAHFLACQDISFFTLKVWVSRDASFQLGRLMMTDIILA